MLSLETRAEQHGLSVHETSNRTEIRKGKTFLSFHSDPEKALKLALDRLEEDRLKRLRKEESEPIITGNEVKNLIEKVKKKTKGGKTAKAAVTEAAHVNGSGVDGGTHPLPEVAALSPEIPLAEQMVHIHGPQIKGSIIKKQYKDRYKKNGDYSCGDDMAGELRAYIELRVGNRITICLTKLRQVAEDNGVWNDRYLGLNAGQQRMTIGNRLRSKMKQGDQIDIGGAILQTEVAEI